MMKLVQINVDANNGSNGSIARNIGTIALNNGWKSYIAFGRNHVPCDSTLIKVSNNIDVRIHGILTRLLDIHGLGSIFVTYLFIRKLKKIKPNIVHLHNIHGYYINYKMLFNFLSKNNIPTVWTLHDCWSFTGHCAHFEGYNCYKWKIKCSQCPGKKDYPASFLYDNSNSNFLIKKHLFNSLQNLTIVPVSNWLANYVKESFLGKNRIKVIHNGINLNIFKPSDANRKKDIEIKYNIKGKKILLGVSSTWNQSKGLFDFFKLRNKLSNNFAIILVGLSKNQLAELPNGIIGIERTDSINKLVEFYSSADVFVNPTYADTYPTVNLEAIACGTPVVTYKTGGSPESIVNETGLVVSQGNIVELTEAISRIANNGKDMYQQKCRDYALKHFDNTKCFNVYFELYQEILGI